MSRSRGIADRKTLIAAQRENDGALSPRHEKRPEKNTEEQMKQHIVRNPIRGKQGRTRQEYIINRFRNHQNLVVADEVTQRLKRNGQEKYELDNA